MALVKKLQKGETIAKTNTKIDYNDLEKKLYEDLYSMSSKEAKRSKEKYDQVAGLIRSGILDKAVKFNNDGSYSIDINQVPEELKSKDWQGHDTPLNKDLLGMGSYVRGKDSDKEALTSAMSFVKNYIESNKQANTENPKESIAKYDKSLELLGNHVIKKYYGGDKDSTSGSENFQKSFKTLATDDEKKLKVKTWANEYLDEYLKDSETNGESFNFKDLEKAKELKSILADPTSTWEKLSEKALGLNWRLDEFLKKEPKTQAELDKEEYDGAVKVRDERVAKTLADNELIKQQNEIAIAKNHNIRAAAEKLRITNAKIKYKELEAKKRAGITGGATFLKGTGKDGNWNTADYLDATALGGDVVSLGGTVAGIGGGLTSTFATLGSDILRGHGLGETLGNVGMNLGFTALSLIPGAASAKLGARGAKYAAKATKLGLEAERAEKLLKAATKVVKEGKEGKELIHAKKIIEAAENVAKVTPKVEKYGVSTLKNIVKKPVEAIVKASPLVKTGLVGYGLVNAGTAVRQTAYDVEHGGWGNVSLQDARGLVHGALALKGLRNVAIEHAGTTRSGGNVIQEATKEIKLKNVPEGIESKIIIPKNAKPEVIKSKINEHFDKVINTKNTELETLRANKTPTIEQTSKMESLTKELESLKKGKSEAVVDKSIKERIRNISGKNNKDYKEVSSKTRNIKSEADPRSWYGKKFQEYSIKQLTKGQDKALNSLKNDEKSDKILKLNRLRTKERANKKIHNTEVKRKWNRRKELNSDWKKYQDNMVEHKQGGILKYQKPASGIVNGSALKVSKDKYDWLGKIKSGVKSLDNVDLMNSALYLNTINANKTKASKDIQAYLNVPLKTLAPTQKLRIYDQSDMLAKEATTSANKMGEKYAKSTSNANVANAARAEMWTKGNELAAKYKMQGSSVINQGIQKQNEIDYRTLLYNIGVGDTNKATIKSGQSKALMTEGVKKVANNAALNNLFLAYQKNKDVKTSKQYQTGMFDLINNKDYKKLYEDYNSLSDEGGNKFYKNYLESQKLSGVDKVSWDASPDYKLWTSEKEKLEKLLKPYSEKMNMLQTGLAYGKSFNSVNSAKKGGNIIKKIESDRKLFYKAIDGVNNLVNKNSIDLSKSEKEALSSDKLFYMTVLKNNKNISKSK